jgi:hypothetical protein
MTRGLGVSAALLLLASPAHAAIRCVNPTGAAGCFSSIQAAVTAAASGDTVRIAAGVYLENITVPAAKDGLKITGAGRFATLVDPDAPNAGSALVIQSNGVKVSNIGIRNGQLSGIDATANNTVVQGVRIVGLRGSGVGISTVGTGNQVILSEVRGCTTGGILMSGDNAVARSNTVVQVSDFGIIVQGNGALAQFNKVVSVGTDSVLASYLGLEVLGNQALVVGNAIQNVGLSSGQGRGLVVTGANPTVQLNRLTWAGEAIVTCTTCTGGKALANSVTGSAGRGFVLSADAAGFVAQLNRAVGTSGTAFDISGSSLQALQNGASDAGFAAPCFQVTGSGHTVTSNMALRCGGAGFRTQGDTLTLSKNSSMTANTSGYLVDGDNGVNPAHTNVTLSNNKAAGTNGQGYAVVNAAASTAVVGNIGLSNRVDLCDAGTGTTSSGNKFTAVPPTTTSWDIQ